MNVRHRIAVAALAASTATGIAAVGSAGSGSASASTHVTHQLPAWIGWGWASRSARAHCHGGQAFILWVAGHPHRGVVACDKNEIILPGVSASTRSTHNPPAWLHWTRASQAASADCHGGPAEILWIHNSDQSAEACKINGVIFPS